MSQDPYSSAEYYHTSESNLSRGGEEMMDTGQPSAQQPPPPQQLQPQAQQAPQPAEFGFQQETNSQRSMSISNASTSATSSPKVEQNPLKRPHMDQAAMRRSPRLTQAQMHQQQQQQQPQYVSAQKVR